jgi:peroxiredoxin
VIAASSDRPEKLRKTLAEHSISYTLLSDSLANGSRGFGIAWKVPDAELRELRGYGIDLEEASGADHHLLPVPAVFLIDRGGVIRFRYANPDYKIRIDTESLLEAARRVAAP